MKAPEKSLSLLKVSDLFEFMGVKHPVFVDEETKAELIYTKGLVDQIGIDWKNQRMKLNSDESVELYNTVSYKSIAILEGASTSQTATLEGGEASFGHKNEPECLKAKEGLYLPLESVQMYLARLSTAQVKSQGNGSAAEFILSLQKEWLKALHSYETQGFAEKQYFQKQDKSRGDLLTTWEKLKGSSSPKVRAIAEYHIEQMYNELGLVQEEKKQA
ncbi:TPA: hypothetical protein RUZ94_000645 [Vibrio cholerae]|nr:hypothetical protein [Vibrio cholerae]